MARLLDAHTIRRIADEISLVPTKKFGQNFVTDANTVRRIVNLAGVKPGQRVLEVGPGLGSLTLGLLEAGAKVTAVEISEVLARRLPETVGELAGEYLDNLQVIQADAMQVSQLDEEPSALVANLPYNVAVPVLLTMLQRFPGLTSGLVMVQLEVAERLVAKPGSKIYGVPSLKMAWYGKAQKAGLVGPKVFWPIPNVDSGLVSFVRDTPPDADRETVFALVDAAFNQRRKMLRASLATFFSGSGKAAEALRAAGIAETARGETLTIDDFVRLSRQVNK